MMNDICRISFFLFLVLQWHAKSINAGINCLGGDTPRPLNETNVFEDLTLDCDLCESSNQSDQLQVDWFLNDTPIVEGDFTYGTNPYSYNLTDSKLQIIPVLFSASYSCNVTTIQNITLYHHTYDVRVRFDNIIPNKPKNQTAKVGENVTFSCYTVDDRHRVDWYKSNLNEITDLEEAGAAKELGSESYDIIGVSADDAGWYSCYIRNIDLIHGYSLNFTAFLTVERVERVERVEQNTSPTSQIKRIITSAIIILIVFGVLAIAIVILISYKFKKKEEILELELAKTTVLTQCIIKKIIIEKDNSKRDVMNVPKVSIVESHDVRKCSLSTVEYEIPVDEYEFCLENLKLGEIIGEGEFGRVFKAEAYGILQCNVTTIVAVKMLKDNSESKDEDMQDLVTEMEIMKIIGKHDNVLSLLGYCCQDGILRVIMEYAANGNLRDYLRTYNPPVLIELNYSKSKISEDRLLKYAYEVARGMEYLASMKCIHRDIAARNILVTADYTMKISDFGLARDIHEKDYYKKKCESKLPIKWMAPEALFRKVYTTKSDVWSYGVLLWEIMTMGGVPYPSVNCVDKLFKYLHSGNRMEIPPDCSVEVYNIMRNCWSYNPNDRPDFSEIVNILNNLLTNEEKRLYPKFARMTYSLEFSEYSESSDDDNETSNLSLIKNLPSSS